MVRELRCEATERLAAGVNDVPVSAHAAGFGEYRCHVFEESLGPVQKGRQVYLSNYLFAKRETA
jgi:hypothetical protein